VWTCPFLDDVEFLYIPLEPHDMYFATPPFNKNERGVEADSPHGPIQNAFRGSTMWVHHVPQLTREKTRSRPKREHDTPRCVAPAQ